VKNQNVDDQTEAAGARSMNTGSKDKILSGDGSLMYGVASLPLGMPVELELIFEVSV
jgi:hypothetical protein